MLRCESATIASIYWCVDTQTINPSLCALGTFAYEVREMGCHTVNTLLNKSLTCADKTGMCYGYILLPINEMSSTSPSGTQAILSLMCLINTKIMPFVSYITLIIIHSFIK